MSDFIKTQLDKFGSKSLSRRICREYEQLASEYESIFVTIDDANKLAFTLCRKGESTLYKFVLPNDYPFVQPSVLINDKPYISFLNLKTVRFNNTLKYVSNFNCLCCNSICFKQQWSPAYTIKRIMAEIDKYKQIKIDIAVKLLADQIKDKYLISDIDLDSWLFANRQM
jgi:ubiquitin-protein ligase